MLKQNCKTGKNAISVGKITFLQSWIPNKVRLIGLYLDAGMHRDGFSYGTQQTCSDSFSFKMRNVMYGSYSLILPRAIIAMADQQIGACVQPVPRHCRAQGGQSVPRCSISPWQLRHKHIFHSTVVTSVKGVPAAAIISNILGCPLDFARELACL